MHNLKVFKTKAAPFPDLWPERGAYDTLGAIKANVPKGKTQGYLFALKDVPKGVIGSVIVQPAETVLSRSPDDTGKFQQWCRTKNEAFKGMSHAGTYCTIVGILDEQHVFNVMYVVMMDTVYVDSISIRHILGAAASKDMVASAVQQWVNLSIDSEAELRHLAELVGGRQQHIAIPITGVDARRDDSGEVIAASRLVSTPTHMRFMAFTS